MSLQHCAQRRGSIGRAAWCAAIGILAVACGGAKPPAEEPEPPTALDQSQPPGPEPAAASEPQPPREPSARVLNVVHSKESAADKRAKILFENPTDRSCRFVGYKLTWDGGSKQAKPSDLVIGAGETRERWLRLHPNDGDLSTLEVEGNRIELELDCSPQ